MPKVIPSGWRELEVAGAALREIETLAVLEAGLPDELTVFHGVHWTRIDRGYAVFGEIDFVIVTPGARVLLIEQKSGFLSETPEGLVKKYEGREKLVAPQLGRTLDTLRRRLAPLVRNEPLTIDYLLYCPDYTVRHKGTAGIPPERIVDAPLRRCAASSAGASPTHCPKSRRATRSRTTCGASSPTSCSSCPTSARSSAAPSNWSRGCRVGCALGAAAGLRPVPAARDRHSGIGQDATRVIGADRSGQRGP